MTMTKFRLIFAAIAAIAVALPLSGAEIPHPRHGPILTNPADGAVTVVFTSDINAIGAVEYRKKGDAEWKRNYELNCGEARRDRNYYNIRMENLIPGAEYEYRTLLIGIHTPGEYPDFAVHAFTAPGKEEFTAFIISDTQLPKETLNPLMRDFYNRCGLKDADMLIALGDNYEQLVHAEDDIFEGFLGGIPSEYLASHPIQFVRGNHEFRGPECQRYTNWCALPDGKTYGLSRLGGVCFVILDSMEDEPHRGPDPNNYFDRYYFPDNYLEEQRVWLAEALKSPEFRNAEWKIVLCHGSENPLVNYSPGMAKAMRKVTGGAFSGHNPVAPLHLWITGHVHIYARTIPFSDEKITFPTHVHARGGKEFGYITVSNDGPGWEGADAPATALILKVNSRMLEMRGVTPDGKTFDHFSMDKDGALTEYPDSMTTRQ